MQTALAILFSLVLGLLVLPTKVLGGGRRSLHRAQPRAQPGRAVGVASTVPLMHPYSRCCTSRWRAG